MSQARFEMILIIDLLFINFSVAKATLQPPMSVRSSISLLPKPPNNIKSIIPPYHFVQHNHTSSLAPPHIPSLTPPHTSHTTTSNTPLAHHHAHHTHHHSHNHSYKHSQHHYPTTIIIFDWTTFKLLSLLLNIGQ